MSLADVHSLLRDADLDDPADPDGTHHAGVVMLAAILVGPHPTRIATLTGYTPGYVTWVAANLSSSRLWDGDYMNYLWIDQFEEGDGALGVVTLTSDCMTANGILDRVVTGDGVALYRLAPPIRWVSRPPPYRQLPRKATSTVALPTVDPPKAKPARRPQRAPAAGAVVAPRFDRSEWRDRRRRELGYGRYQG